MHLTTMALVFLFVILCFYEMIRTKQLNSELEKPLKKHLASWKSIKRRPRKSSKRDEINCLLFCYSQLTNEEMDNQEILLESKESDAGLLQQIVELLFKTIIPIGTFILLAFLTTNNNLLSIFTKKAESDPKAYESINRLATNFDEIFKPSYQVLISIAFFTFYIAITNLIGSNIRKRKIKLHQDVIKKVKENAKSNESDKETNSN